MPEKPWPTIDLINRLHDVAWTAARGDLRAAGRRAAAADDPSAAFLSRDDRLLAFLALLVTYGRLQVAMARNIEFAIAGALGAGATFGEIGQALHVTRQAARQKWVRLTEKVTVTLVGGPRDSETAETYGGDPEVQCEEYEFYDWAEHRHIPVFSVYRKKYGSPGVYAYVGHRDSRGRAAPAERPPTQMVPIATAPRPLPATRPHKIRPDGHSGVRVHELAQELGITSKQVLDELRSLGEHVRSPSSRIEPSIVQAIRARRSGHSQNQ